MGEGEFIQFGCAALWRRDLGVIVAAAAGRPGSTAECLPWSQSEGGEVAALALSAALALDLAVQHKVERAHLLLPGPLELAARVRTNAPLPELSEERQQEVRVAHSVLSGIRVTNTLPGVEFTLQQTAELLCRHRVDPVQSPNGHQAANS